MFILIYDSVERQNICDSKSIENEANFWYQGIHTKTAGHREGIDEYGTYLFHCRLYDLLFYNFVTSYLWQT